MKVTLMPLADSADRVKPRVGFVSSTVSSSKQNRLVFRPTVGKSIQVPIRFSADGSGSASEARRDRLCFVKPVSSAILVTFEDGLTGRIEYNRFLRSEPLRIALNFNSACIDDCGAALAFTKCSGGKIQIDAMVLRSLLDPQAKLEMANQRDQSNRLIGRRIRASREAAGLSLLELGRCAGMLDRELGDIEDGRASVGGRQLIGIARALRTDLDQLLRFE